MSLSILDWLGRNAMIDVYFCVLVLYIIHNTSGPMFDVSDLWIKNDQASSRHATWHAISYGLTPLLIARAWYIYILFHIQVKLD